MRCIPFNYALTMREIIVCRMEKSDVELETLYTLFSQSFQQWRDQGIDTPFVHTTLEKFQKEIKWGTIFVAQDAVTGELLAMHRLQCYRKHDYAFGSYLAVDPKCKHEGIATRLLKEETIQLRQRNYRYLKGTTSKAATWSVRWHLKNGYRIIGYSRSEHSNAPTYTFRKQLFCDLRHHPTDLLWTHPLAPITARLCFLASYLAAHLCKDSQGCLNKLGRLTKRILKMAR